MMAESKEEEGLIPEIEEDIEYSMDKFMQAINGPDEDTCNALGDASSCKDLTGCSWCISAAVKPACHTIENAKSLPAAVFQCDPLSEEPVFKSEEEPTEGYFRPHPGHHRRHHGHCAAPVAVLILIVTHFVLMKKLADAQEAEEKVNGTFSAEPWSCKQAKEFRHKRRESKTVVASAPVVEHSNLTHTNAINNNMA